MVAVALPGWDEILADRAADDGPPSPRHRSVWLVGALCGATCGLYANVWFGLTWAELHRERRSAAMRPVDHALAILVPIYGLVRVHAHFRAINERLAAVGIGLRPSPCCAVGAWAVGAAVATASPSLPTPAPGLLHAAVLGAVTAVVVGGQAALNLGSDRVAAERDRTVG